MAHAGPSNQMAFDIGGTKMPTYNDRAFMKIRSAFAIGQNALKDFDWKLKPGGGKGGNLMGRTPDSKFIIKEMNDGDHNTLVDLTESYVNHIIGVDDEDEDEAAFKAGNGGKSLLCRFYVHFYNPNLKKNFVVMNNWLPPFDKQFEITGEKGKHSGKKAKQLSAQEVGKMLERRGSILDLKGTNDDKMMKQDGEEVKEAHKRIYKLHMWMGKAFWNKDRIRYWAGKKHAEQCKFHVSQTQYEYIEGCIRRDCEWLIANNLMDYSLIVGSYHCASEAQDIVTDRLAGATDNGRQPFICQAKDGVGTQSSGGDDKEVHVLYLGIIDFLQEWNTGKKIAMRVKFLEKNKSTVPPSVYGMRFIRYFENKLIADGDDIENVAACPPSPLKSRKSALEFQDVTVDVPKGVRSSSRGSIGI